MPTAMDARLSWLVCAGIVGALIWLAFSLQSDGGQPAMSAVGQSSAPGQPSSPQPSGVAQVADRSSIDDLLNRTFTQNDPRQCTKDMTRAFLSQYFDSQKGMLDRCRRANTPQEEPSAKSIAVESVNGAGSSATAVVRASSSNTLDGSVMTLRLVREGGRWKLDQLVDLQIDRGRFDQHLRDELGARGYLPAETSCAVAKLDRTVSNGEIENNAVLGESSYDSIGAAAVSCLSRPTLIRELGRSFTAALAERGIPSDVARCVVDRLTRGVPIARLRHLLAAGERGAEGWYRLGSEAALACSGGGGPGSSPGSATT